MSTPAKVNSDGVRGVLELLQSYGPNISGYVLAMVGFSVFMWLLAVYVRQSQRSMQSVWQMGEQLRESMRKEKAECEQECRRLREINDQLKRDRDELIRQHSAAREEFLQEARERELMQGRLLAQLEQQTRSFEHMKATADALRAELDAIRKGTRGGGG